MENHHIFLWFSYGFPLIFRLNLHFPIGFPIISWSFPWFSMVFLCIKSTLPILRALTEFQNSLTLLEVIHTSGDVENHHPFWMNKSTIIMLGHVLFCYFMNYFDIAGCIHTFTKPQVAVRWFNQTTMKIGCFKLPFRLGFAISVLQGKKGSPSKKSTFKIHISLTRSGRSQQWIHINLGKLL